MTHLDLFSGIGGFALAARWANIKTVGFCEIDEFCKKILSKNFPGIPINSNILDLDGEKYAGVDIITGGYPCQPFSVGGRQKAHEDERHLWPEMFRIIAQAKPTWAICENVLGHVALGLDCVLNDLESIGYSSQSFVIPALSTGANHNRERVFIVAHSPGYGLNARSTGGSNEEANDNFSKGEIENFDNERCGGIRFGVDWRGGKIGRWGIEPPALRVDVELPNRMDRNKSLGNSIDPMIAFELLKAIKISDSKRCDKK